MTKNMSLFVKTKLHGKDLVTLAESAKLKQTVL